MTVRRGLLALVVGVALPAIVVGQTPTQDARADGQVFGGGLAPSSVAASQTPPNANDLPNFTANPTQSSYYDNPSSLEPAAQAQAPGSVGYQAVTESLANRATFPTSEIDATVATGKAVNADPYTYVSGFSANGAQGSCVPIPSAAISPGTYEQTCNTGYIMGPGGGPQTCQVTLDHSFATVNRYECSEVNAVFNGTDDCSIYDGHFGSCTTTGFRPGQCLVFFGGPEGGCAEPGEPIREMECASVVPGGTLLSTVSTYVGSTPNAAACAAQAANPDCTPDPDVCTDSTPTTRLINGVSITQPCWAWERTYQCGGPLTAASDCGELEALGCTYLREECITGETPCLTVDRVYACPIPPVPAQDQQICDADVYCLNGECDTINRQPNTEFQDALVALNSIAQAGKEFDEATLEIFKGQRLTCSKTIFGLTNCCVPRGFPLIGGCNGEDQILKDQREQGLCTYVGTFCDQKFLGICLRKKEAHCCFVSKISRILQEQGRPQINKPWDDPEDEKCLGFTIAEFQLLDLSVMDFAEVYAEFTEAAQIPADLDVVAEMQSKINAFYAANPPGP